MASKIKPVGVGYLLVVKQQIIGYERAEIAFIENILKGETHVREVRRSETSDVTITREEERLTEEERDLQSTERFELQRESEQQAETDGRLRSTNYGGLVEFSNSTAAPAQGSLQASQREATTYAREITSRAVSKVSEKIRTQMVQRTIREFEEKTAHTYENKLGDNVCGVYQWVDKIYHNQVYSYGKRLLYDLIVPEPGAFLIQAFARAQSEERELIKPPAFTLDAAGVTEGNYAYFAARYEATGVQPPPPLYQTVCHTFTGTPGQMTGAPDKVELDLPDGYQALSGYLRLASSPYNEPPAGSGHPCIQIVVSDLGPFTAEFYIIPAPPGGIGATTINGPLNWEFTLFGANGHLPIAVNTWYIVSYAFVVGITVRRSDTLYSQWQSRTYDALLQAYLRKKADYEERLANVLAALKVGVIGQSSAQKRKLERDELKKSCISIITNQFFDAFNAINIVYEPDPITGESVAYPQVRLPHAQILGTYMRFFEQAFEWEQLMYGLYSYFWGRKDQWMRKLPIEDTDEAFAEFLRAGAARVVLPVRPGYEEAVVYFMEKGLLWDGGAPPEINSPLYVPLIAEIREAQQAAGAATPYGDPWTVKLPSSLVALRTEDGLPAWKNVGGEWVPA
ncbi:hypothetical protein [Sphingomonas sp.]|uniref:hypothetical protein n=1 Tax=Sphingomonas sp. TaxID=28214 RepID=UPI003D6D7F90